MSPACIVAVRAVPRRPWPARTRALAHRARGGATTDGLRRLRAP